MADILELCRSAGLQRIMDEVLVPSDVNTPGAEICGVLMSWGYPEL